MQISGSVANLYERTKSGEPEFFGCHENSFNQNCNDQRFIFTSVYDIAKNWRKSLKFRRMARFLAGDQRTSSFFHINNYLHIWCKLNKQSHCCHELRIIWESFQIQLMCFLNILILIKSLQFYWGWQNLNTMCLWNINCSNNKQIGFVVSKKIPLYVIVQFLKSFKSQEDYINVAKNGSHSTWDSLRSTH